MLQFVPATDLVTDDVDAETNCRRHVFESTFGHCSSCGDAFCEQCLVELPMHGVTCTSCALEIAGVRRATRRRRRFGRS